MAHSETLDLGLLDSIELVTPLDLGVLPEDQFRITDPHWLRSGLHVEALWLETRRVKVPETVMNHNSNPPTPFERMKLETVSDLHLATGIIAVGFPSLARAREQRAQGIEPYFRFTPDMQSGERAATVTVPESRFEDYLFFGLPKAVRFAAKQSRS